MTSTLHIFMRHDDCEEKKADPCASFTLRRKIDAGHNLKLIRTIRRVGYGLDETLAAVA